MRSEEQIKNRLDLLQKQWEEVSQELGETTDLSTGDDLWAELKEIDLKIDVLTWVLGE